MKPAFIGAYCWRCAHTHQVGRHPKRGELAPCGRCPCAERLQAVPREPEKVGVS